jgi:ribA/ribD-fused uncharacterized protein
LNLSKLGDLLRQRYGQIRHVEYTWQKRGQWTARAHWERVENGQWIVIELPGAIVETTRAMNFPEDREELRRRIEAGERFQYLFFYGHKKPADGDSVDSSCLSQWYDAGFEINGIHYSTAEHWMMAEKARLFDDMEILEQILSAPDPKAAKALGRKVRGFEQDKWKSKRVEIVILGNLAKFGQNENLNAFLQATAGTILVEAAARDVIWGIGLGASNEKAKDPSTPSGS